MPEKKDDLKIVKAGETSKPGHHDILGDPLDAPFKIGVMAWWDTLREAIDFARENGCWFASQSGAVSPDELVRLLSEGKKLWQIFGLPPGFNPQQMQHGDLNQLQLCDPMTAVQQLRARAELANSTADKIQAELRKPAARDG